MCHQASPCEQTTSQKRIFFYHEQFGIALLKDMAGINKIPDKFISLGDRVQDRIGHKSGIYRHSCITIRNRGNQELVTTPLFITSIAGDPKKVAQGCPKTDSFWIF